MCTPCQGANLVVTSNVMTKAQCSSPDVTTVSDDDPEEFDDTNPGSASFVYVVSSGWSTLLLLFIQNAARHVAQ